MTNQQLATIHGISAQAVGRWSEERKRRAIIDAQAGVNPEVKRLIGELAGLCYVAQRKTGEYCYLDVFKSADFDVTFGTGFLVPQSPLNAYELQGAIAKLEGIIYG